MIRERETASLPGLVVAIAVLVALGFTVYSLVVQPFGSSPGVIVANALLVVVECFLLAGLFVVNPNEGRVLQLFGAYVGTVKMSGLRWASPFYTKRRISLRVRNFESGRLKVNDHEGNPI